MSQNQMTSISLSYLGTPEWSNKSNYKIFLQALLTHVSRGTKSTLNKLGVFTVSSFHAFICARSPSLLNNLLAGRGATKRRAPNLSRSNSGSSRRSMQVSSLLCGACVDYNWSLRRRKRYDPILT